MVDVIELRCTNCLAPLDPTAGATQRCPYCGTVLLVEGASTKVSLRLEECGPNKIQVIGVIREITRCGLKEAKEMTESTPCTIVESIDATWAQRYRAELESAGARVSGAGTSPQKSVPPMGSVVLESAGDDLIAVIKVIREHTGLGLRDAKDLAQRTPSTIEPRLPRPTSLRDELIAAGARVR